MKKGKIYYIKIPKISKKSLKNNLKSNFFFKISDDLLNEILKFLNEKEKIYFSQLDNKFLNIFLKNNNINKEEFKFFINYFIFLSNLQNYSKYYSSFVNNLLNINISNLVKFNNKDLIEENGKIKAIIYYINLNLNHQKKYYLKINDKEDIEINYKIILNLKNKEKLKYFLDLKNYEEKNLKENSNFLIKLFKEIPLIYFNKDDSNSKNKYFNIQIEIMKKNIECYFNICNLKINICKNYFKKYPEHLLCLNNKKLNEISEFNLNSIKKIKSNVFFDFNNKIKNLKKIIFNFCDKDFNEIINSNNLNIKNLNTIGGFVLTNKKECDNIINIINNLNYLKKINPIEFEDENLFSYFLDKINKDIEVIKLWQYSMKKNIDYSFIVNKFPNLRKLNENYDSSGLYDSRFEIENLIDIPEGKLNQNDLISITKIINNYLKYHKDDNQGINFNLINNQDIIYDLFEFWDEQKENDIINSINYIYNEIEPISDIKKELKGIKKINLCFLKNEQISLISLLNNLNFVSQFYIENNKYLDEYFDFIKKTKPLSLVLKDKIDENLFIKITKNIISLKYLICNEDNIKSIEKYNNDNNKLILIPIDFYILNKE